MANVLVVANETLGGHNLIEAVRARAAAGDARFTLVVPQNRPRAGLVIYDDAVFEAAQVRVDLALSFIRHEGIEAVGEVGDPDPYTATMDAVRAHRVDEIIISTLPHTHSGWLRRGLVERVRDATGVPVEHIVNDPDAEGLPFAVTLVVANRTAGGEQLLERLKGKVDDDPRGRLFIALVPQEGGDGAATRGARERLSLLLGRLREAGLVCAGMIGDPDPYTATTNALQYFRVSDIVVSTYPATRSGWLRADLIERVRRSTAVPVEHVVGELEPAHAAS